MKIVYLEKDMEKYISQVADLLRQAFPHSYEDTAVDEVYNCLEEEKVALIALENDRVLGFIGAMPQYGMTAWELHPLVVSNDIRGKGIGKKLCLELESILKSKGCLTIYLGSDDESFSTSLGGIDLFENTYDKIMNIKNIDRHPYEFYEKVGYKIVGVIPDANGLGKPDIWMAKSLR